MDLDLGEMFLNFPMDPKVRPYAGVDFKPLKKAIKSVKASQQDGPVFLDDKECWEGLFMGMRPSPFVAIQYLCLALEFGFWVTEGILEIPCNGIGSASIFRGIHSLMPLFL